LPLAPARVWMSKSILFCATGITHTVGGIASANRNLQAALAQLADEVGASLQVLTLGEDVSPAPGYRGFAGRKLGFALAAVSGALSSQLVVFDHVQLSRPVMMLPRALRPPVVILAHGSEATWRVRPASVKAFRHASLVLTNSHYTLERMQHSVGAFPGAACPLGLSPQFKLQSGAAPGSGETILLEAADGAVRPLGDQVLLLVSRLDASEREKGHRELLSVFPRLASAFPGVQLVFVGAGSDLEPLRELARATAAADRIFLPGRLVEDELQAIYRQGFAYVMPSRQEGFGLAYLEAMNFAKPCLACRDDGGGEVVVDGQTGVLIPRQFSEDELFSALSVLLADPVRAQKLGEGGRSRLAEHYTSEAHQARVMALVRPLLTA